MKFPPLKIFISILLSYCTISNVAVAADCRRIVSLAPSITEIIYALGLGDRVVGVTRYCIFPSQAKSVTKIGGFLDPNLEGILMLRPTLVVMPKEHREISQNLKTLGIASVTVNHSSISGILESIAYLGKECEAEDKAESILSTIREKLEFVKTKVRGLKPIRTMVVVGRGDPGTKSVFVSGRDGFYSDMITLAGGVNVNPAATIAFPVMSAEGILKVNPEIIFEIAYNPTDRFSEEKLRKEWSYYQEVSAIRSGNVYMFNDHVMSIPGPRFVEVLERMARLMHPNAEWN